MTNVDLSKSYLFKAKKRLKILDVLFKEGDFSDVAREAQEIVELALKGLLRYVGVDVPRIHDVSNLLLGFKERFPSSVKSNLKKLVRISKYLRKERELAFYGEIDFIPTEEYTENDAQKAKKDACFVVETVLKEIKV